MSILEDENFILWVLFMATNKQQTTNYKQIFLIVLLGFLALLWWRGYLVYSSRILEKGIISKDREILAKRNDLDKFSENPWYDKLLHVKDLENNNKIMPWSDHVEAIMAIFDELLAVDSSDTYNISFSDFEISLEDIRLNGHVSSLRLLYQWAKIQDKDKPGLIQRFEELDFLDNISIKTYEKTSWDYWYDFTLTANVINNGK